MLHGGLGHSGNWGYQVPALAKSRYRAVLIDSRGHGRSMRDSRPFMYELMASDVLAVMDKLQLGIAHEKRPESFLLVPIASNMENIININAYDKNINSTDAHSGGAIRLCK